MKKYRDKICFLALIFFIISLNALDVFAQQDLSWSFQERVPGYDPLVKTPYLIADQNRVVHAFNSTLIDGEQAIVYSQWTPELGWTYPNDILLPPLKNQVRLKGAILDSLGVVHLLFFSGDELEGNIYYSFAPLSSAGNALAWSTPVVVGEMAITPDEAAFVINGNDQIFVLYSSNSVGNGLLFTYSVDRGVTWSEPIPMFLTYNKELFPFFLQMYVDKQDVVHALWNINNSSGLSEAFYYAKLEPGQEKWSEPIGFEAGGINQPSIFDHEGELILVYHSGGDEGLTRYMRRSLDGGQTWTEQTKLFSHVGSNGPMSFAIDSNNILHGFFGNRVTDNSGMTTHGMWHTIWDGNDWSDPEAIVSGSNFKDGIGGEGFDPSFANAVISQGNVILLTWRTDPQAGFNGVWYSYTTLEAPELLEMEFPTVTPLPDTPKTSVAMIPSPSNTNTLIVSTVESRMDLPNQNSPLTPVFLGVFPAIVMILVVILVQWKRRKVDSRK